MSQINYVRYKYTPDEIGEKDFLERFVVRTGIFDEIFDDLIQADYDVPNQHYIIIGQRGQGKTTLLRKIQLEVQNNKELSKFLLPVKFAEEQYQIRSLCRLWEEVADYLESIYEDEFTGILDNIEEHFEDEDYDLRCFSYLEEQIKAKGKKLLLLIDNIDELLGKLKEKEQRQLREILLTSSTFRIIGGSTKMIEQHYDYGKPFYEFFNIIRLHGLSHDESISFLRVIGRGEQKEKIEIVIENTPERIETLRQLTGGVPRTLVMLFDIFVDDDGNAFEDLLKILDEVTPLYKDRMDTLPPALQDIVHTIAMNWDGMLTKEIAKKTRMDSKTVSAQLKQLEKYQIITFESTGKNKIYKIQERFFNIWYLMRFGRKKDRQRVEWLVKFLVSWYSQDELQERANKLIETINNENIKDTYVYHMSEALGYAGLDTETEYNMKVNVKNYLEKYGSSYVNEVSSSDIEILKRAHSLLNENRVNDAISVLIESRKSGVDILLLLALLYDKQNQYNEAVKYYLMVLEKGDKTILSNLGDLYLKLKQNENAEKYYLQAVQNNDYDAMWNLAWLYFSKYKKIDDAITLARNSYKNNQQYVETYVLAVVLLWAEEFDESYEKYYELLNFDGRVVDFYNIGHIYLVLLISKGQYYQAKKFLEMSEYQLKERFKPIWYALMTLMQDEFPNEIKKMGSELQESVDAILKEIEEYRVKYAL